VSLSRYARFTTVGVATTYGASSRNGLVGGSLIRIIGGTRVAGPATTALCGVDDNLAVHRVLETVRPGDVVVVTTPGPCSVALVGELLALQAKARGAAGLLIDGAVRDVDELVALGLPIWARSIVAAGAAKDEPGALGLPVVVGGAPIEPGDVVVLDGDGAVVVPRVRADEVLVAAEVRRQHELALAVRLEAGELTLDAMQLRGSW